MDAPAASKASWIFIISIFIPINRTIKNFYLTTLPKGDSLFEDIHRRHLYTTFTIINK